MSAIPSFTREHEHSPATHCTAACPGYKLPLDRAIDAITAELRADNDAAELAIAATPIAADLLRVREVVRQRKAQRFTVAEVGELHRLHAAVIDAMQSYRQSAFSVADLVGALTDAGYEPDEYLGDITVRFGNTTLAADADVIDFHVNLALAAPRYAHAILVAGQWNTIISGYIWDVREIARRAA